MIAPKRRSVVYRFLLIFPLLLTLLEARDNPFFPAEGVKDLPVTSSEIKAFDPLKRAAITLPDSARVLKKVTVEYQNLDGSVGKRSIDLDNSVDWHLPLFVSQSYSATKTEAAVSSKPSKKQASTPAFNKIAGFTEATFYQSDKTIKIATDDPLLRHFMLVEPHRIVLDFKRDADFLSKSKLIEKGKPFTKIRLGNHKGYYRVVIELDGQYRYDIDKRSGAIFLRCY
jgi:hypothetical protein